MLTNISCATYGAEMPLSKDSRPQDLGLSMPVTCADGNHQGRSVSCICFLPDSQNFINWESRIEIFLFVE